MHHGKSSGLRHHFFKTHLFLLTLKASVFLVDVYARAVIFLVFKVDDKRLHLFAACLLPLNIHLPFECGGSWLCKTIVKREEG